MAIKAGVAGVGSGTGVARSGITVLVDAIVGMGVSAIGEVMGMIVGEAGVTVGVNVGVGVDVDAGIGVAVGAGVGVNAGNAVGTGVGEGVGVGTMMITTVVVGPFMPMTPKAAEYPSPYGLMFA